MNDGATDCERVATLLVRDDVGMVRLHFGDGAAEVAARLGNGHCFDVLPVFSLPHAPEGLAGSLADIVAELGGSLLGNGWFAGVALDALAARLVRLCVAVGSDGAATTGRTVAESQTVDAVPPEQEDSPSSEGAPAQEDEEADEEVWQYVEACPAAEADKALDIRAAMEQALGKPEARRLLACSRGTVAKQNGHKNRILRIGATALKLRRSS